MNSPGSASRAPDLQASATICSNNTGLPWALISTTSSPVYDPGSGNDVATTRSIEVTSFPRRATRRATVACRGCRGLVRSSRAPAITEASVPLIRTTPSPPRPGGVAMATIVSSDANIGHRILQLAAARPPGGTPGARGEADSRVGTARRAALVRPLRRAGDNLRAGLARWVSTCPAANRHGCRSGVPAEIRTVLRKASPMLSEDTPGSSAIARCTIRRAYGFSGPISWVSPDRRARSASRSAVCRSSSSLPFR